MIFPLTRLFRRVPRTGARSVLEVATKPLSNRIIQVAFGTAVAILLGVATLSYRSIVASSESDQWVDHTRDVLKNIEMVRFSMETIISGARGFVLTGSASYLDHYRAGRSDLDRYLAAVRNLTADNLAQQLRLSVLEKLATSAYEHAESVINLRRSQGLEAAAGAVLNGPGQKIADDFQTVIHEMQGDEEHLLASRNLAVRQDLGQTKIILITETLLGLLITGAAGWSVLRDDAARKLAEKATRESDDRFRDVANNMSQLAWTADEKGSIFWYNSRWFEYTGIPLSEMSVESWQQVHHPDHVQRVAEKFERCFKGGEIWEDTFPIRGRNGGYRWFLSRAVPIRNTQGTVLRWFGTHTDITERMKAEDDLLQKVAELNRSNTELGQFAYIASHDLQEPLRMVASYTQLLSKRYKGKLDSDADEFIAFAVDGANRMQRLIQDLLAYSRVGTGDVNFVDVSSEDALQRALGNLCGIIERSGAVVTHDPLPNVIADEMQLVQLFQNLLGNGIKYQGSQVPRVHVSAAKNGAAKWTFAVQDNGIGIDAQYFERIFGMFQRLHKRDEYGGTGIGLAICKKIVEQHGDTISVESQLGQGSTFRFALAEGEVKS